MKISLTAALMFSAACFAGIAAAGPIKPDADKPAIVANATPVAPAGPSAEATAPDARSLASDQDVGTARRAYRAACTRHENAGFCDCVTAGVAQALMPAEVRIAARTLGERLSAQGDAYGAESSDATPAGSSSAARIEQVEAHYADACQQFRS